jgi:hypothetical protein
LDAFAGAAGGGSMKTLKDIIVLRGRKYADDAKNPSYSEFLQGCFEGWKNAYRDIEEILEQNNFNLDVPVTDVGKTNADHIRSMTDEELAEKLCSQRLTKDMWLYWLKRPYKEDT